MPSGINTSIAQMDPTTKQEIWLFQEIGTAVVGGSGQKVFRRLPYNLVRYDGDQAEYIEPDSACGDFWNTIDGSGDPIDPRVKGAGMVVEIRYCTSRPFETFSYNEVDVANTLGQLPDSPRKVSLGTV